MEHSPDDPFDPGGDGGDAGAGPSPSRALIPVPRHDGFTPERRRLFKQTLRETGCVRDACRVAGISDSTAYRARADDPDFAAEWDSALAMAAGDYPLLAWQRGVEGVEEEVWAYGKRVGTRIKRDDRIFRLLVQQSARERSGGGADRRAAAARAKADEKILREQIEYEERIARNAALMKENAEKIAWHELKRILNAQLDRLMCEAGFYFDVSPADGRRYMIPVGYVWTGEAVDEAAAARRAAVDAGSGFDSTRAGLRP